MLNSRLESHTLYVDVEASEPRELEAIVSAYDDEVIRRSTGRSRDPGRDSPLS